MEANQHQNQTYKHQKWLNIIIKDVDQLNNLWQFTGLVGPQI